MPGFVKKVADISLQHFRKADSVELVRLRREQGSQSIGFASRPFVLCGLPIKRPASGVLLHERRNGRFILQVTGHPHYGLPYGQDRLIPLLLTTLAVQQQGKTIVFGSAASVLEEFGLQSGGKQYRRLIEGFKRVFGATIFFGTDSQAKAGVFEQGRFNFISELRLWYSRDPRQSVLTDAVQGSFQNRIVLTDEFFAEIKAHPIPADLEAIKVLAAMPAVLDLFVWLCYRCKIAAGEQSIPLFGEYGLANQLGSVQYSRERKFRQQLNHWLAIVHGLWPECPAEIASDGQSLSIRRANAIAYMAR